MATNFEDVGEFHRKFDLPTARDGAHPAPLSADVLAYRIAFMLEELTEFSRAASRSDLVEMLDALVDLAYVVHGTAHLLRLPFDEAWAEVHRSNLAKERGPTAARGHFLDVRKPPTWRPPEIGRIIAEHVARLVGEAAK